MAQPNSETRTDLTIDLTDQFLLKMQKQVNKIYAAKITTNVSEFYLSFPLKSTVADRKSVVEVSHFPKRQRLRCQDINANIMMVQQQHLIPL